MCYLMAVTQSHEQPGAVKQCIYLSPGDGLNQAWVAQMIAASSLGEKGGAEETDNGMDGGD